MTAVLAIVLGAVPREEIIEDRVEVIELNHYYDLQGKKVFDQLIFLDWCKKDSTYRVRAWRMAARKDSPSISLPRKMNTYYSLLLHDTGTLRRIRSKTYRETWTQYDPEVLDREHLHPSRRMPLTHKKKLK